MASPPIDPVIRHHATDTYTITGRDMEILQGAHHLRGRNARLEAEIVALQQLLDECPVAPD